MIDERPVPLNRVLKHAGDTIVYEYDLGDGWRHDGLLEAILPINEERTYPLCMAGARARSAEDVGGVWGYAAFLEAIADPARAEHEELLTWVGGMFDPASCDVNMVNRRLQRLR